MSRRRAFFLGAGASRADGFPLTRDINDGVIHTALADEDRYGRILRFLRVFFDLAKRDFSAAADRWQAFSQGDDPPQENPPARRPPDIAELLSLLDVLIADESFVCGEKNKKNRMEPFSTRDLLRIRETISRAVAGSFSRFANDRPPVRRPTTADKLARKLHKGDVVITTNWDLLMDDALDRVFDTDPSSTGTDAIILTRGGKRQPKKALTRPPLFKLHGSLNWLVCLRCTNLYINPQVYIADFGFYRTARKEENTCDCGMPLRPTLITPTYFKQYRIRHFANIWAKSQHNLALCDEWYFIGYSLPSDDIHIRALLLRALHARRDSGCKPPKITVVTDRFDQQLNGRYRSLFPQTDIDPRGFRAFVK